MLFESPSPGCSEPEREAVTIAERKQRLISFFNNVAEISAERMDELSGKDQLAHAGVSPGIATDKFLPLLGEKQSQVAVQINFEEDRARAQEMWRRIRALPDEPDPEAVQTLRLGLAALAGHQIPPDSETSQIK